MAGDWIPMTKDLDTKPEALSVASSTGISIGEVVYALYKLWSWADTHSTDGVIKCASVRNLSAICPTLSAQFLDALERVGWIRLCDGSLEIPKFTMYMGNSAKRRIQDARQKRKNRDKAAITSAAVRTDCGHLEENLRTTEQKRTEQSREMNLSTTLSCPETLSASSEPSVLTFPTDGKIKSWNLTQSQIDKWREAYPSLDILGECKKALAWIEANPEKRKTAKGMKTFLVNWLNRSQDRGRGGSPANAPAAKPQGPLSPIEAAREAAKRKGGAA
jgi:hypothetical protein